MLHISHIGHFMELLGNNYSVSQDFSAFSLVTDFNTSFCYPLFTRSPNSLKLTFLKSNIYVSQNQVIQFTFLADII